MAKVDAVKFQITINYDGDDARLRNLFQCPEGDDDIDDNKMKYEHGYRRNYVMI